MGHLFSLLAWGPDGWGDEIASGVLVTVGLAFATLPFGLLLGFLVALAKRSDIWLLNAFGNLYTTIFRGLPELLTLFIVYYGGQILLQKLIGLFFDVQVEINSFLAGMIALGVVFSAYSSEVFLGAFQGISRGQAEASRALGLSRWLTLRLVIVPQLLRLSLPGLCNLWLVLLKDTALVSVIGLPDTLRMTNIAVGVTKEPFFFYLICCLIFLVLAVLSSIVIGFIESRVERGQRRSNA
ncbi:MAG: ABC transporter permease [Hyphomicrobiaceae bacterium]|nr:ABC transporter permease [Hyphomicrobiaceae bacterium]